ncbi:MAG: flagellar protein FlaG [Clostridia bacterium]|nr:flagellar protein FlaG [Clostridia bacterium]
MRIEGVDPVVLNQVQAQTRQPAVQEMKKISITAEEERQGQEQKGTPQDNLERSVRQLNLATELFDIKLRFKIDDESGELYVLVIDVSEGKVIRRIPPEKVINVAGQMKYMVGILLDEFI